MAGVGSVGNNSVSFGNVNVNLNVDPSFLTNPGAQEIVELLNDVARSEFSSASTTQAAMAAPTIDVKIDGKKISLPNPLYRLDSKVAAAGGDPKQALRYVGQFLTGGARTLPNGQSVVVPGLNQRLAAVAQTNAAVAPPPPAPAPGNVPNLPTFGTDGGTGGVTSFPGSGSGDMYGGVSSAGEVSMTPDEQAAYAKMTPAEQAQYMLQKKMEAHARMVALMTNLMKMLHDTLMGVIQNIKS